MSPDRTELPGRPAPVPSSGSARETGALAEVRERFAGLARESPVALAEVRERFAELARESPAAMRRRPWVKARPAEGIAVDVDFEQYGRDWSLRSDEARERGGAESGPSPMRHFLAGLATCLIGWTAKTAEEHGVPLRVESLEVRTMLDMRGETGLADVPAHPLWFVGDIRLAAGADERAPEILREAVRRCPISALAIAAAPVHLVIRERDALLLDERPEPIRIADDEELTR